MAEPIDFDQIAREFLDGTFLHGRPLAQDIAEQFRQVWNARGAVDITKIEHELSAMMGPTAAGPYLKNLNRALLALDRYRER
jgi:hypothetical protein